MRLTEIGRKVGLVNDKRYKIFKTKLKKLEKGKDILKTKLKVDEKLKNLFEKNNESVPKSNLTVKEALKRPNIDLFMLNKEYNLFDKNYSFEVINELNIMTKFDGYLKQQEDEIERAKKNEDVEIPADFDYSSLKGLRAETIQKLTEIKPLNIGQASRISGISPADIAVLTVLVKREIENRKKK